ncbi:MAG: S-layer homology domain-containing protein [Candidatus Altimarinota bacterium]
MKKFLSTLTTLITLTTVTTLISLISLTTVTTFLTNISYAKDFSDVTESDWFYPYIQEITEDQLMVGYPDGRFGPWDPVNRAEMAKILYVIREDLQSDWLLDNIVELALVLITLLAWISIVGTLRSISRRPIVIQHINEKSAPNSTPVQKGSRLIAEEPNQPMENRKLDDDFNQDEGQRNQKTNWWL